MPETNTTKPQQVSKATEHSPKPTPSTPLYFLNFPGNSNPSTLFLIPLFLDICEDLELRERILQLKNEQDSKRQAEAQKRRVRRSQSNTRTQSVRRTSLRDKGLTARRDAVEEARLRMQAENQVRTHKLFYQYLYCTLFYYSTLFLIHRSP